MRPLRLEVKGFTAFRDRQELDLADLDVFAIAGPTGSGKSSLLDAMTYALYGRVERVGDRVGQLVSQGQPRMAVMLEFEVGYDRFRVTRSTPAKGATKVLLERLRDGEWSQAGDGADRVREAGPMIARMIGLTYDGFTRSVLLPQGRFAEFLVGDPRKRRDILTELLGLSLFRRVAERAGAIARDSAIRAQTMTDMLGRYADATAEALAEAKAAAKGARIREKALGQAAEGVVGILGRWEKAKRSMDDIHAYAEEASRAAEGAAEAAGEVTTLSERLDEAAAAVDEHASAVAEAQKALDHANAALRDAEAEVGSASDLVRVQVQAHALTQAARAREAKEAERADQTEVAERLAEALAAAELGLAGRQETVARRETDLREAEATLEEARHADLVAAVSARVKAGDPCPVCGLPLKKAPKRGVAGAVGAVEKREKAVAAARRAVEAAGKHLAGAQRFVDTARREVEANATQQVRLTAEIDELDRAISDHRTALREALGDPLPSDPAAALEERLAELQRLDRAERDATRAVAEVTQATPKLERERDRVAALIDRVRDRLGADHQLLFDRAARALGKDESPVALPSPPKTDDPAALRTFAAGLAEALSAFAGHMEREVEERSLIETGLLDEAVAVVDGLVGPAATLEALARAVDQACKGATAEVATSAQTAGALADRIEEKKQLAEEAKVHGERSQLFRRLALELRADRLIAFLQAEALQVLATAGSTRLATLSDGRYRLACREDEFFVVDTWNGDEERSVRTLSGGETFLASLALALALSEQVRSLSVTDRARLDSLFLDEGFGTLDQESLRVVVEAIEQLGGNGRLVGVITHVPDLAEQFPRFEVLKSPRGSRVSLVA
ncbi:MAG: AAA family ATPase [Actinomycetota bacterium]